MPEFGKDLAEAMFEPVESTPGRGLGELTAIHLHQVAGCRQGLGDRWEPRGHVREGGRRERQGGQGGVGRPRAWRASPPRCRG